jgi:hypothetical protein
LEGKYPAAIGCAAGKVATGRPVQATIAMLKAANDVSLQHRRMAAS